MRPLLATLSVLALAACGAGDDDRLGQPGPPAASPTEYSSVDVYSVANTVPAADSAAHARTDEEIRKCLVGPGVGSRREGDGAAALYVVSLTASATGTFEACIASVEGAALSPYDGGGDDQAGQDVKLHHCGIVNVTYEGQEWEVEHEPFDGTNAPDSFSGYGTFSRNGDTLTFVDREGAQLTFTPYDGTPDPEVCA